MILVSSSDDARSTRQQVTPGGLLPSGSRSWRTNYIGRDRYKADKDEVLPPPNSFCAMAYIVEQPANSELRPHFHTANQFQIIVAGSGTLGGHPLETGSIHFASAYSPYGPIMAGSEGVSYMTLRNGFDEGSRYMPESRAELRGVPRQHRELFMDAVAKADAATLSGMKSVSTETVMAPDDQGLGVWRHLLPSGASVRGPDPRSGGAQFWVVQAGSLERDGKLLPPLSCIFISPHDEAAFTAKAGPQGLDVLTLQFPIRDMD